MSLRSLSDSIILSRTQELTRRERSLTLQVLLHLNEIERRKLHVRLGYASMFVYCTSGLGYSASAAARRIRTARCVVQFPEILPLLQANLVNLTTIAEASRVLRPENQDVVLARIRGKSQDQVRAIVAEYEPRALPRDTVRPVAVTVRRVAAEVAPLLEPVAAAVGESTLEARAQGLIDATLSEPAARLLEPAPTRDTPASDAVARETSAYCRSGSDTPPASRPPHGEAVRGTASTEVRYHVSLTATPEFMAKFNTIKALACYRLPRQATLAQVIEFVMDAYLEKEHPAARRARREKRAARATTRKQASPRKPGARIPIAAAVKDDVFARGHGQCSYVGTDGRICGTRHGLQIDHVRPVACGGGNDPANLRLLCAHHNRLEAERVLGPWPPTVNGSRCAPSRALPLRE